MSRGERPPRAKMTRGQSIFAGFAFIAAGAYPLAIGLGFAAARPGSVHAPLWVVAIAGACFVLVGTVLLVPEKDLPLRGWLVGLMVTGLAAIFDWVAFGPGERHFSGGLSFGGASMRAASGETSGRLAFGIAAVLLDAFALWGWYRFALRFAPRQEHGGHGENPEDTEEGRTGER